MSVPFPGSLAWGPLLRPHSQQWQVDSLRLPLSFTCESRGTRITRNKPSLLGSAD